MVLCEKFGIRTLAVVSIGNNLNVPFSQKALTAATPLARIVARRLCI